MAKKIHDPAVTREVIKKAFLRLLDEKSYDQITVAELTREAGINRVTFYSHYDNVVELMEEIETEFASRIISSIDTLFQIPDSHVVTTGNFINVFFSTPEVTIWFMNSKTTGHGEKLIYDKFEQVCMDEWRKHSDLSEEALKRFFAFYYTGSMSFLKDWLQSEHPDSGELRKEFIALTGYVAGYIHPVG